MTSKSNLQTLFVLKNCHKVIDVIKSLLLEKKNIDPSKVLKISIWLSSDKSLESTPTLRFLNKSSISIYYAESTFAWRIAISIITSILLLCKFWIFVTKALIYNSKNCIYFDHKS